MHHTPQNVIAISTDGRPPLLVALAVVRELASGFSMAVQEYDVDGESVSCTRRTTRETGLIAARLRADRRAQRVLAARAFAAEVTLNTRNVRAFVAEVRRRLQLRSTPDQPVAS